MFGFGITHGVNVDVSLLNVWAEKHGTTAENVQKLYTSAYWTTLLITVVICGVNVWAVCTLGWWIAMLFVPLSAIIIFYLRSVYTNSFDQRFVDDMIQLRWFLGWLPFVGFDHSSACKKAKDMLITIAEVLEKIEFDLHVCTADDEIRKRNLEERQTYTKSFNQRYEFFFRIGVVSEPEEFYFEKAKQKHFAPV